MIFEITILGSGSASATTDRAHSSQFVQVHHHALLFDCGEGTQTQLKRFGLKFGKISHIFISHLHGDHYLGLIGLLSTLHLNGRKDPLWVYGPPGLAEILTIQFKHSDTRLNYPLSFVPTNAEEYCQLVDFPLFTVHSFPLKHRIHCTGFLVKEKKANRRIKKELSMGLKPHELSMLKKGHDIMTENGDVLYKNSDFTSDPPKPKSYAYCSDTIFDTNLIPYIQGVNLLYHEATFTNEHETRAKETFHSTAEQAGKIAKEANVEKLLIGHFSPRYPDLTVLLNEAKRSFPNTVLANDGDKLTV